MMKEVTLSVMMTFTTMNWLYSNHETKNDNNYNIKPCDNNCISATHYDTNNKKNCQPRTANSNIDDDNTVNDNNKV